MDKLPKRVGVYRVYTCLLSGLLSLGLSTPLWAAPQTPRLNVDTGKIDGLHGVLRINGVFTDSPCRLSMQTADQTIDLGTIALGDFPRIGATGDGITFQIELMNCLAVENAQMNRQTGQIPWSKDEPGVAIRFVSTAMDNSGRYVLLNGVSGLGLEIHNAKGDVLPLDQSAPPTLLPAGQSTLTYRLVPVRLAKRVSPGEFSGVIGFQLSYD